MSPSSQPAPSREKLTALYRSLKLLLSAETKLAEKVCRTRLALEALEEAEWRGERVQREDLAAARRRWMKADMKLLHVRRAIALNHSVRGKLLRTRGGL